MTITDGRDDFWLEGLEVGNCIVIIEKSEYFSREIKDIDTEINVNLGNLELYKEV